MDAFSFTFYASLSFLGVVLDSCEMESDTDSAESELDFVKEELASAKRGLNLLVQELKAGEIEVRLALLTLVIFTRVRYSDHFIV